MTEDIVDQIRELDDLTAVKLLRQVGPMLFKDPKVRSLVGAFPPTKPELTAESRLVEALSSFLLAALWSDTLNSLLALVLAVAGSALLQQSPGLTQAAGLTEVAREGDHR